MDPDIAGSRATEVMRHLVSISERWALRVAEVEHLLKASPSTRRVSGLRILIEIDRVMSALLGDDEVASWVSDRGPTGLSPLDFLALGEEQQHAMLIAAHLRHRQILGFDA